MRETEEAGGHPAGAHRECSHPVSTRGEKKCVDPDPPW